MSQQTETRRQLYASIIQTINSAPLHARPAMYRWAEREAAAIVARRRDKLKASLRVIQGG